MGRLQAASISRPLRATRLISVCLAVFLLAPAANADAVIVPQQAIAGVKLGMKERSVRAKLGKPRRVVRGSDQFGKFASFYYRRGIVVGFRGTRVNNIYTDSKSERTSRGVGVGSSERTLRRRLRGERCRTSLRERQCSIGRGAPGGRVTRFRIRRQRVVDIFIARVLD